jgi:predicted AlkP superfamily pyrophosphatase or phosphodiesterase
VIGISLKDRAAILPAGHMADAAYWFKEDQSAFVTSTYYRPTLPEWLAKFNKRLPDIVKAYQRWLPVGGKLTDEPYCTMQPDGVTRRCPSIEHTPLANELLEELAETAIENEALGTYDGTDILALSFSANDIIGHDRGPDAPEIRDISIRTDLLLGKLLDFIERRIGAGKTLVVFTADHGVAPVPQANNERKMPGGWVFTDESTRKISERLSAHFQKPGIDWIRAQDSGFLYLNDEAIAQQNLDATEVRRIAADAARTLPNIARVFTRDDLLRGSEGTDRIARAVQLGFYGPRSADLILVPEPYYLFTDRRPPPRSTTHLTPYSYDSHVPLIFMGPAIRGGSYYGRVVVNDVAPTLAAILGVESPSGSSGRILGEMLK